MTKTQMALSECRPENTREEEVTFTTFDQLPNVAHETYVAPDAVAAISPGWVAGIAHGTLPVPARWVHLPDAASREEAQNAGREILADVLTMPGASLATWREAHAFRTDGDIEVILFDMG